jgi:uncharacterized repeat protein (TIGR03843 family)
MTDWADRLATAPYEVVGRFADASNATLLARLVDRDPAPLPEDAGLEDLDPSDLAVYKPRRGETPLWDFPDGSLHRREVAAFLVSEALGWGLVPTTVRRDDGPFGDGSLQRFVTFDPELHYFALREVDDPAIRRQLEAMVLFDIVVDNADRKGGHVLLEDVDGAPHVRLIDHGVCFHAHHHLRTVAWDYALEPVPDALRGDVARLGAWLDDAGRAALAPLLDLAELDALAARIRLVVDELDTFPEPVGPRPFPWPLL